MTTSRVESYPVVRARKLRDGLGFGVQGVMDNEAIIAAAKAAGAVEVRAQFPWESVQAMDGTRTLLTPLGDYLDLCVAYGLKPLVVAAYGPPRQVNGDLTAASDVAAGEVAISTTENPTTAPQNVGTTYKWFVLKGDGSAVTAKSSYYGSLIDTRTTSSITLASALTVPLTAGDKLTVRQLAFPPIDSTDASNASVVAYVDFVEWIAGQITAKGLTGRVELWNEPTWPNDFWDDRGQFYDSRPGGLPAQADLSPGFKGVIGRLLTRTAPTGIDYVFAGTHKTGTQMLGRQQRVSKALRDSSGLRYQAIHPYPGLAAPEVHAWDPATYEAGPEESAGSNFRDLGMESDLQEEMAGWRIAPIITEVGVPALPTYSERTQAIGVLRQFLIYHALGLERVNVFSLIPGSDFGLLAADDTPYEGYEALAELQRLLVSLDGEPLASVADHVPTPSGFSGDWPLAVVPVGCRLNRLLVVAFLRDYGASWLTDDRPAAQSVAFTSDGEAGWARNLITGASVAVTDTAGGFELPVGGEPVAIQVDVPAELLA